MYRFFRTVTDHIADVVVVLGIAAIDGEFREVGLRLGIVADGWTAATAWEGPDDAGRPFAAHVDLLSAAAVEHVAVHLATAAARRARCQRLATLVNDVNLGTCIAEIIDRAMQSIHVTNLLITA